MRHREPFLGPATLYLGPDGRYRSSVQSDVGEFGYTKGAIKAEGDLIRLVADPGSDPHEVENLSGLWRHVKWDRVCYLIKESEMLAFVNSVNLGLETGGIRPQRPFFARAGGSTARAAGWPDVPTAWHAYLLKAEVHGRVTRLLDGNENEAEIDVGAEQGLREGLELWAKDGTGVFRITVKAVRARDAIVTGDPLFPFSLAAGQVVFSGFDRVNEGPRLEDR